MLCERVQRSGLHNVIGVASAQPPRDRAESLFRRRSRFALIIGPLKPETGGSIPLGSAKEFNKLVPRLRSRRISVEKASTNVGELRRPSQECQPQLIRASIADYRSPCSAAR